MKKILYVCHEPLPSPHTNTEQAVKTLAALTAHISVGIDLIFPRWSGREPSPRSRRDEIADFYGLPRSVFDGGIHLIEETSLFCPLKKFRPLRHDIRAARRAKAAGYDLAMVRDPLPLAFMLGAGIRTVFETYRCDLNTLTRYRWWRKYCYGRHNLAGIITHSERSRRLFSRAGIPPEKVITAYNGAEPPGRAVSMTRKEARQALGWPESADILVYAGRIHRHKGIETLLAMAGRMKSVRFMIVGGRPGSREVLYASRRINSLGLTNLILVPRVAPSEIPLHLAAADILLIPPTASPLMKYRRTVLPIKTFRYLSAGRPILAPRTPDIQEILKDRRNAVLVPPDSIPESVSAARSLLEDGALRERISSNARRDAEKFTWDRRGEKIAGFLNGIL